MLRRRGFACYAGVPMRDDKHNDFRYNKLYEGNERMDHKGRRDVMESSRVESNRNGVCVCVGFFGFDLWLLG